MAPPAEWYPQIFHDVYDGIDPSKYVGTNKGRVVFITGGSRGLGLAAAKAYAASGASLFLTARNVDTLAKAKTEIESTFKVPVAYSPSDMYDEDSVKAAVEKAVEVYGKIDIVIANAGGNDHDAEVGDTAAAKIWWATQELNVKGSFFVASYSLEELRKSHGYIIFLSSHLAQWRIPRGSAYNVAKLSLNRLAEWIDTENKGEVKAFAIHPGAVLTDLALPFLEKYPQMKEIAIETPEISAWTEVRLTSGTEDWLSGRYVDVTWGLDELAKHKESILADDALKVRLALPQA